jgi:biotin operon repressor
MKNPREHPGHSTAKYPPGAIGPAPTRVMLAIMTRIANDRCVPTVQTVADDLGLTKGTVWNHIAVLRGAGLLRPGGHRPGRRVPVTVPTVRVVAHGQAVG